MFRCKLFIEYIVFIPFYLTERFTAVGEFATFLYLNDDLAILNDSVAILHFVKRRDGVKSLIMFIIRRAILDAGVTCLWVPIFGLSWAFVGAVRVGRGGAGCDGGRCGGDSRYRMVIPPNNLQCSRLFLYVYSTVCVCKCVCDDVLLVLLASRGKDCTL